MQKRASLQEVLELTKKLSPEDKLRLLAKLAPELERESSLTSEDGEMMHDLRRDDWRTFTYEEVN